MVSRGRRRAVGLVAAGGLALSLTGCADEDRDLGVGDAIRVLDDPAVTRLADEPDLAVRLPVGELGLGWTDDPDLIASVTDDEGRSLTASDDATLVAVAWDLDPTVTGLPGASGAALVEGGPDHELALVSGGERTVLVPRSERALRGSAVAAVADAADVALEVTFDGVTQLVGPVADDRQVPALAQPLYADLPRAERTIDCRPAAADAYCRADAAWLPWVAGQGWAPEGQLWAVVRVEARVPGGDGDATLEARLESSEPVAVEDLGTTAGVDQLLVFPAVAPEPASLEIAMTDRRVTVRGEARLSPAPPTAR